MRNLYDQLYSGQIKQLFSGDEDIYAELATHDLFNNLMSGNPLQIKHIADRLSNKESLNALMEQLASQDSLQLSGPF